MHEMTIREIGERYNVTRRAIQGYEEAGIIKATERNKYGYLLYSADMVEKIRTIKMYQDFGFTVKEIRDLYVLSKEDYLEKMDNQLIIMKAKMTKMKLIISEMENLIEAKKKE